MSHEDRPIMSGADAAAWLEEFCGLRAVQIEIQPSLWKLFNRDHPSPNPLTGRQPDGGTCAPSGSGLSDELSKQIKVWSPCWTNTGFNFAPGITST